MRMRSVRSLALAALAALSSAGCVAYSYERDLSGTTRAYDLAPLLVAGQSTIADALEILGSPDLLLRVNSSGVNRAYYTCWDSSAHRIVLTVPIPFWQNAPSLELAVLRFSSDTLWLLRLDADPSGRLTVVERETTDQYGSGQYYGISGSVISTYLEDEKAARLVNDESLVVDEDEDDEEDARRALENEP